MLNVSSNKNGFYPIEPVDNKNVYKCIQFCIFMYDTVMIFEFYHTHHSTNIIYKSIYLELFKKSR
jgi:hypothetical protein